MGDSLGARSTAEDVLSGLDLSGRNMLVTGCNSGIGFETARALAAHGAHVLLACRTRDKADTTATRIASRHPEARLSPVELDLGSFDSVRRAVDGLAIGHLDVLICNAGLYSPGYDETRDGLEQTVGVCHFGHFLLATALLDRLRAARAARVVMVSSESHRSIRGLDFERFPLDREHYEPLVAYGQAKLCNVLFARELSRRYADQGIVANALHPGSMIRTSIFRDTLTFRLVAAMIRPWTKSVEQGAATSVHCAASPALEGMGGHYFIDCAPALPSSAARDPAAARALWELSERRIAARAPR